MEPDFPPLSTITNMWNWAKSNIDLWCLCLVDLKSVIAGYDLDDNKTLVAATQFSAFPVVLAELLSFPVDRVNHPSDYGTFLVLHYLVVDYVLVTTCAFGHWAWGRVVRGKGSLRGAFIVALLGCSYFPFLSLLTYLDVESTDRVRYLHDALSATILDLGSPSILNSVELTRREVIAVCLWIVGLSFILSRFIRPVAYVQKIGKIRALTVCVGTALLLEVMVVAVQADVLFGPKP